MVLCLLILLGLITVAMATVRWFCRTDPFAGALMEMKYKERISGSIDTDINFIIQDKMPSKRNTKNQTPRPPTNQNRQDTDPPRPFHTTYGYGSII